MPTMIMDPSNTWTNKLLSIPPKEMFAIHLGTVVRNGGNPASLCASFELNEFVNGDPKYHIANINHGASVIT